MGSNVPIPEDCRKIVHPDIECVCDYCGKDYYVEYNWKYYSYGSTRHCSKSCAMKDRDKNVFISSARRRMETDKGKQQLKDCIYARIKANKTTLNRKKISEARKRFYNTPIGKKLLMLAYEKSPIGNSGEDHYNWQGGISKLLYPSIFDDCLKTFIRERDNNTCVVCKRSSVLVGTLHVHHIDYDKMNCNCLNLISLCHVCHVKTNGNRYYWKEVFTSLQERRWFCGVQ